KARARLAWQGADGDALRIEPRSPPQCTGRERAEGAVVLRDQLVTGMGGEDMAVVTSTVGDEDEGHRATRSSH
ncbi:MAG: hypothetical protein ACI8WY_000660, partial [Planctomycetota bacterium]